MSEQKCEYFDRNKKNSTKIDIRHGAVYCACADVVRIGEGSLATSACGFQRGPIDQQWFKGVTYWKCAIADYLLEDNRENSDADSGIFSVARDYHRSLRERHLLASLGL